jgi:hypothetical protein
MRPCSAAAEEAGRTSGTGAGETVLPEVRNEDGCIVVGMLLIKDERG